MSQSPLSSPELLYFGKLPSRGDFVRSGQHASLIESLDRWQSQMLDRLSPDPRWKLIYDAAPAVQFAILGSARGVGLAGQWLPSQDASGRRFPFVTAAAFDLAEPEAFMRLAPVALAKLWTRLEQVARVAHAATDLAHAQASLNAPLDITVNPAAAALALDDFLAVHTVASLEQMLAASGTRLSVRQATLALGMLLQPAMTQGAAKLNKVLQLPLVTDPALRGPVAAYWLSLIVGFFTRHDLELALFVCHQDGVPHLLVGFQGASAVALLAAIDPAVLAQHSVSLMASEWVEDEVLSDYGLRKLSTYLRDPGVSLSQVLSTYREVFLGA